LTVTLYQMHSYISEYSGAGFEDGYRPIYCTNTTCLLNIMTYALGQDSQWRGFLRLLVQLWEVQLLLLLKGRQYPPCQGGTQ